MVDVEGVGPSRPKPVGFKSTAFTYFAIHRKMVRDEGFAPPRTFVHCVLSAACLLFQSVAYKMVGEHRIELWSQASDARSLPLADSPMVGKLRFELRFSRVQGEREQPDFPISRKQNGAGCENRIRLFSLED